MSKFNVKRFLSFIFCFAMIFSLSINSFAKNLSNKQIKTQKDDVKFTSNASHLKAASEEYPEKFDLRDLDGKNYVTPVKFQNPFGTCWAFGSISAIETSILHSLGLSYDEFEQEYGYRMDLSEKQSAYFSAHPLENNELYPTQNGEGVTAKDPYNAGGHASLFSALIASGVGPLYESTFPYHGKNGLIVDNGNMRYYSPDDDWSLDESDRFTGSEWEISDYEFIPAVLQVDSDYDEEKFRYHFDEDNLKLAKSKLMEGKGLAATFQADSSRSEDLEKNVHGKFINYDNYAHYTYIPNTANHQICIVGWDDTYSKDNFLSEAPMIDDWGNIIRDKDGNIIMHPVDKPPKDGAWICKNSWGASEGAKHAVNYKDDLGNNMNLYDWGAKDENGKNDGYFYLSYWDLSMMGGYDCFNVDVNNKNENPYYIMQYDLLPVGSGAGEKEELGNNKGYTANVFSNVASQAIRAIGVKTSDLNTEIEGKVYLLNKDYKNPTDGKEVYSFKKTYNYIGYHKYNLPKDEYIDIPSGSSYSIVISEKTPDGYQITYNTEARKSVDVWGTREVTGTANSVINKNESFIYKDNNWIDMADHKEEIERNFSEDLEEGDEPSVCVDNMSIKAYAEMREDLKESDFEKIPDQKYTGKAYNPSNLVKAINKELLAENRDYKIVTEKCTDLTSKGEQKISIKGIGMYVGDDVTLKFNIVGSAATGDNTLMFIIIVLVALIASAAAIIIIKKRK